MSPGTRPSRRGVIGVLLVLLVALAAGAGLWCHWVYRQIQHYAYLNQAAPADAICILGAAEYDGKPSPVYRARLEHALDLYQHGLAPLMITLGGWGGDQYSEGGVGRTYLMSQGVPEADIIAETHSRNTEESIRQLVAIARANDLHTLIVVSDGIHLFRIRAICASYGLEVLTSPRPRVAVEKEAPGADGIMHEILSYTAWRLHLH